jgi:RNA polymerase sigma-70 factor (ECF subfamily)
MNAMPYPPSNTAATVYPVIQEETSRNEDEALAKAWLQGVANGDRNCFQKLHERFENLVFSTVQKVLNDREDAEDVTQEVFATVWRKAPLYSPEKGKPATWVASMARNRAIDRLRFKQRRARLRDDFENEERIRRQRNHVVAGVDLALRRERCQEVQQAVLRLAPEQQQAIRMAYFDGMTQQDIATHLGKPLGTVKARIRRAMAKLRGQL